MSLGSSDDATKVGLDRPLIAYAFLAQTKSDPSDLMSGLAPIFIPIAKQLQGENFSAEEFARKLKDIYGIKIHPWAVEDLTPRLEACGILIKAPFSEGTASYIYSVPEDSTPADEVTEGNIRALLHEFSTFARAQFKSHDLDLTDAEAEQAFLEHLVLTDFSSVRTRTSPEKKDARTLSLSKKSSDAQDENSIARHAQLDVICASYILEMFENNRGAYDLIVRVAHGALLAEVVLNVQNPESKVDLQRLTVILDAPLVMSVLDVRTKESTDYARAFIEDLKAKGASIKIFAHSIEEIEFNLKSVVEHVAKNAGHGATARRLIGSHPFKVYLESVRADVRGAVERIGIKVTEAPSSAQYLQEFSEDDEDAFFASLGSYSNHQAQIRDAKSVASIIRLRRGITANFKRFETSSYIFVTENDRVADRSSKLTGAKQGKISAPVPPALTDRFFAGMMWVTFGGKTDEMTQHRLLANCVSALEPRTDVLAKVHQFLAELDDQKADHFRALMTEERSGQHVMQLTLGDALLIRSTEDASELLRKLEDRYVEKSKKSLEDELERTRQSFNEEMAQKLAEHDETVRSLQQASDQRDAETASRITELESDSRNDSMKIDRLEGFVQSVQHALNENRERTLKKDIGLLNKAVASAHRSYKRITFWTYALVFFVIVISGIIPFFFDTNVDPSVSLIISAIGILLATLGFWRIPDITFGRLAKFISNRKFNEKVSEYALEELISDCDIDLETGSVRHNGEIH